MSWQSEVVTTIEKALPDMRVQSLAVSATEPMFKPMNDDTYKMLMPTPQTLTIVMEPRG